MLTRPEVDERSFLWPERTVAYQQWGTASPTGDRPDCSGYVGGCCWDIPVPVNTVSLVTDGWMYEIPPSELKLGDAIGLCGIGTAGNDGHIMLFRRWSGTGLDIAEQNGDGLGPVHRTIKRIPLGYKAYRFKGITEGDDMTPEQERQFDVDAGRMEAIVMMKPQVTYGPTAGEDNWLGLALAGIQKDIAVIKETLAAGGGGTGGGPTIGEIRTVVDEELDEQSRGGADED